MLPLVEKTDPRHSALIIVDLQNDFCHPEGAWAKVTGHAVPAVAVQKIEELASAARQQAIPVLFLRTLTNSWTQSPSLRERWEEWGLAGLCVEGTWGAEFYRPLQETDRVITKYRPSGFMEADLTPVLRAKGIRTLVLTGVAVTGGLLQTACDAQANDYFVVVASDGICGGGDSELEPLLTWVGRYVGELVPSDDIRASWRTAHEAR